MKERNQPLAIAPLLNEQILAESILNSAYDREEVEMLEAMIRRYLRSKESEFLRSNEGITV